MKISFRPPSLRLPALLLALVAGFAFAADADITHRYNFNDGTANDSVGGANGVLINGASVSNGWLVLANNGLNTRPATGQYVSLPANILHTTDFTLETWFTWNGGNPWQRILDLGNSVPDPTYGIVGKGFIILTENSQGAPLGQISINSWGGPDTDYAAGNTAFPKGGEHFLAYIHNLDGHAEQLYLDGALVGTGYAHVDPVTTSYTNFWLGRSQFSQDPFYNGSIDELRTYDSALTAAQIQADYLAGPNVLVVPEQGEVWIMAVGASCLFRRGAGRKIAAEKKQKWSLDFGSPPSPR